MGYVDQNLISGEEIRYRGWLHWTALLRWYGAALLFLLAGVGLLALGTAAIAALTAIPGAEAVRGLIPFAGAACLAASALFVWIARLVRSSSEFAITNKRVILKTGIFRRRTTEMFLPKIESVQVDQGLLARLLNYGTLRLSGTGGTTEPFQRLAQPLEFRRQVQEQISRLLIPS